LGRLVEEDAAGKAVLRLADGVAQGSGPRRVTEPSQGAVARFCATVDRLNNFMGRVWGLTILAVTFAVLYEVVARGAFGQATLWANETTIYLSAMAYLIAGGYALQRRMHVRI